MPNLGEAYVQIIPSAKGIKGSIASVLEPEATTAGTASGQSIASGIKKAIISAGIGAAIISATKSTIDAGADLQQSFGGLETIYTGAEEAAKSYALAAAKAGISANTYAEQSVSFGAALRQALGGDTVKAVEAANTAILDMADNSAKMGTDIGAVQAAYQGFAKQNYTMLDNLKLGYGGTKTEMQRLLSDAQKLTGVKYNIDNLDDVYKAIHVIQGELGIAGVAAEEAASTISGSFGAVKANLQNVMAGLATGMDITESLQGLIDSSMTFLSNNIGPALQNVFNALPEVISTLMQALQANVSVEGVAQVVKTITEILVALVGTIIQNIPAALDAAFQIIGGVIAGLSMGLEPILRKGQELMDKLKDGILNAVGVVINAALTIVSNIVTTLENAMSKFLEKGKEIIGKISDGISEKISAVVTAANKVVDKIKGAFEIDWGSIGTNIIDGIKNGIANGAGKIVDAAKNAAQSAFDAAKSLLEIHSPSKKFYWLGQMTTAGFVDAINDGNASVKGAVSGMANTAYGSFGSGIISSYNPTTATASAGRYGYVGGGYVQNVTINSPKQLSPYEIARQTKNEARQMVLKLKGV